MTMIRTKLHKPKGSKFWKLFVEYEDKYKLVFKSYSKTEANKKRVEYQSNSIDTAAAIRKMTFLELYKNFSIARIEEANQPLGPKPHSVKTYMYYYNKWVHPYFDKKVLITEVTVKVAEEFFKKIYNSGASWITANNVVKTFKTALKYAVNEGYISTVGPMDTFKAKKSVSLRAKDPEEMEYKKTPMITLQEAIRLLKFLKPKNTNYDYDDWLKFAIACVFTFCGLRASELRALRWHHVDLVNHKISIKDTLVGAVKGHGKTKAAIRTFTIHPLLHAVLKTWKTIHYRRFKDKTSYVFASAGSYNEIPVPVCLRTISDFLLVAYDNLGLAKVKLVARHDRSTEKRVVVEWSKFNGNPTRTFRHFSSTSLVQAQAGNPILDDNFIRNYQGHENIETTRGIYADHLNTDTSPERLEKEVKALSQAIPISWDNLN